jgi:hypothetical protein
VLDILKMDEGGYYEGEVFYGFRNLPKPIRLITKFDKEDLELFKNHVWSAIERKQKDKYHVKTDARVFKNTKCKSRYFHQQICKDNNWKFPDHVNRVPLDNRRQNLKDGKKNQHNCDLSSNNKSGENALNLGNKHWYIQWPENGGRNTKCFSFSTYGGKEEARAAAIKFRDKTYKRLGITNGQKK